MHFAFLVSKKYLLPTTGTDFFFFLCIIPFFSLYSWKWEWEVLLSTGKSLSWRVENQSLDGYRFFFFPLNILSEGANLHITHEDPIIFPEGTWRNCHAEIGPSLLPSIHQQELSEVLRWTVLLFQYCTKNLTFWIIIFGLLGPTANTWSDLQWYHLVFFVKCSLNKMLYSLNLFQNLVQQITPSKEKLQKPALELKIIQPMWIKWSGNKE